MIERNNNGVRYITAENISFPHGFSTRMGGVSGGVFSSLNLGSSEHDGAQAIRENYRRFCAALGVSEETLVFTKQVHGDVVRTVRREHAGEGFARHASMDCDALVTNGSGLTLTVFTADCVPVLLCDPVAGVIGAAHAGWRGTAAGIVLKTVRAMEALGAQSARIRAAIGPSLGACCFETDGDVPAALTDALGEAAAAFWETRGAKWHIDLRGVNALWLKRAGVAAPEISPLCTKCRADLFYSHRRDGFPRGTLAAMISFPPRTSKEGA